MKKAIIIGSGFGALSLGIRLQAKGYTVSIFEKNDIPGGHASQFKEKGYTFDMGPSLITAPEIINRIFSSAGKKMEDYVELTALDPFYRVYYHDKTFIDYSGDSKKMIAQMAVFNKKDSLNYEKFLNYSKKNYNAVITEGLGSTPFNKISTMFKFMPRALKMMALFPGHFMTSRYFKNPKHRFLFSFHPLFIGGNPFNVPAIYLMISYLEKAEGVHFTKGGMYSLVQAFVKLFKELGGELHTSSPVSEIFIKEGRTVGIQSNDRYHEADIVISNADVNHTYSQLVNIKYRRKWKNRKLSKARYSMSSFILYLGVKKKYPQLRHHSLILSERYKELVRDIFKKKVLPDDFSMYIHVPTRTDESMAPEGSESIYILIPVANLQSKINWKEKGKEFANKIIDFLEHDFGMEDLKNNIEVKRYFTPQDFKEKRNSAHGSPWGMEPVLWQSAYFRPHNKSEDIPNLYLVGAGTDPGGGLPGVMLSAEATEKLIIHDFGV